MRVLLCALLLKMLLATAAFAQSSPLPSISGFSIVPGAPKGVATTNPAEHLSTDELQKQINYLEQELQRQGGVALDPNDPRVIQQTQQLAKLNELLSSPFVQRLQKAILSPEFTQAAEEVVKSPKRMTLLYIQMGWLVFFLVFRAWRLTKSSKFFQRLWTRAWTFTIWFLASTWIIPVAVLGDSYQVILKKFWEVIFP